MSTHFNIIDKADIDPNIIIIEIKTSALFFCLLQDHSLKYENYNGS